MIDTKCFTYEWIDRKSRELNYTDKNLIEKVIRAFSLLDMLARSGCPFCFKGGSCLMLLLQDSPHRLSIDIDIMCPPGTNIEKYLSKYEECGFIDYELVERRQAGTNIPKSHSKFFIRLRSEMIRIVQHIFYWMSCSKTATMNKLLKLIALSLKLPVAGL